MADHDINNINLNEEICELIGAFIGDGYLAKEGKRKPQYLIGFAGNKFLDKNILNTVYSH